MLVLLAATALPAQLQTIVYHDDTDPTTGPGSSFPFGAQTVRVQQLIPRSVLGSAAHTIQDLFVAPEISANTAYTASQVHYGEFEIRMGATSVATLTTDWVTNSPNATVVHRGPLLVHFDRDQWTPIGLPSSYTWSPASPTDNLVVEFICWQVVDTGAVPPTPGPNDFLTLRTSPTLSIQRAFRLGWTLGQPATALGVDGFGIKLGLLLDDGNFVAHDGSCPGSSGQVPAIGAMPGTWPQAGSTFAVQLTGGTSGSFATMVLGLDTASWGSIPLPFDLTPIGALGCLVWHSPELLLPIAPIGPAGGATLPLVLPSQPLTGVRLYATWLCFDPLANAFGFVPSGFATLIL
jgi:hypothetical protein